MGNNCAGQCGGCYKRDLEIVVYTFVYHREVNNKSYLKSPYSHLVSRVQKLIYTSRPFKWPTKLKQLNPSPRAS